MSCRLQVINDGVSIARAIDLADPVENAGAQLIKEVCSNGAAVITIGKQEQQQQQQQQHERWHQHSHIILPASSAVACYLGVGADLSHISQCSSHLDCVATSVGQVVHDAAEFTQECCVIGGIP